MSVITFPSQEKAETLCVGQEFDSQGYEKKSVEFIKNDNLSIKFYTCNRAKDFTKVKKVAYEVDLKGFANRVKNWDKDQPLIYLDKNVSLFCSMHTKEYIFYVRHFKQAFFMIDSSEFFKLKNFI